MDRTLSKWQCLAAAIAGGAAFFLRLILYRIGIDEKGLLAFWHPLRVILPVLGICLVAMVLTTAMRQKKQKCTAPVGRVAAAGSFVLAICLMFTLGGGFRSGKSMTFLVTCLLAAVGLLVASWFQWQGKQPSFLCYGAACLFMAVYLITGYQSWRHDPQMMDYLFALLGGVAMMLYAYQMAAGTISEANFRSWMILAAVGAFCCLGGASGTEGVAVCFGGGTWMLTGLWSGVSEGVAKS